MKLAAFGYAMFLGWLIRRSGADEKMYAKACVAWEAMQRRSAQIMLEESARLSLPAGDNGPG